MQILDQIPAILLNFVITLLLSLLIGFEQKRHIFDKKKEVIAAFGSDRTFTFIGILGFILYVLDPKNLILFITGVVLLGLLMGIYYYTKIRDFKAYGFTSIIVAFITYTIGPVVTTQPKWLTILIVVAVLILVERKEYFMSVSKKVDIAEFSTLAKFLIIAGVILPISPKEPLIPFINLSPYDIWITIVVVSSISYLSYILQKYVFKKSGVLISGILGGLYSSTATTIILAKKSREAYSNESNSGANIYASSIIIATAMMYIRILLLVFIFNYPLGIYLLPYLAAMIIVSAAIGIILYFRKKPPEEIQIDTSQEHNNPLELKIALLFAFLFILFTVLTHYAIQYYGNTGLNILSFITGFTDIDPFLLNLFQGNFHDVTVQIIGKAVLQAVISNNILKSVYSYLFAEKNTRKTAIAGLGVVTAVNIILLFLL